MTCFMFPSEFCIIFTEQCNLRCKYCFQNETRSNKTITKEVLRDSLEYMFSDNQNNEVRTLLFGGEPFLYPDLVDFFLTECTILSKEKNLPINNQIITNATIFNKDISDLIKKHKRTANLNIQLSIDGLADKENPSRIDVHGDGTFDRSVSNIHLFQKSLGIDQERISIHGCQASGCFHRYYETFILFSEVYQINNLWFSPIPSVKYTLEDVKIYEEQLNKIADDLIKTKKIETLKGFYPLNKAFSNNYEHKYPCGVGRNYISITTTGDLYACQDFYFMEDKEDTIIGNIYEGIDDKKRQIFFDYDHKNSTCNPECKCYDCYRCLADFHQQKGDILNSIKGNFCLMMEAEQNVINRIRKDLSIKRDIPPLPFLKGC